MNKETYITGSGGLVTSEVIQLLPRKDHIFSPEIDELDITSLDRVREYCEKNNIKRIINAAALTDVARAEEERGNLGGDYIKINVDGVRNLADLAAYNGMHITHISTDFVFPGTSDFKGPYKEDQGLIDNPDLLSWYGYTKLLGELMIREIVNPKHAIVRISYPFGNPNNERDFALRTLMYLKKGYDLYEDQIITPTYIPDLAKALEIISTNELEGIFHIACQPPTNPFYFGSKFIQALDLDIAAGKSSMPEPSLKEGVFPRPKYGGLNTQKTLEILGDYGFEPTSWEEAVVEHAEAVKAIKI